MPAISLPVLLSWKHCIITENIEDVWNACNIYLVLADNIINNADLCLMHAGLPSRSSTVGALTCGNSIGGQESSPLDETSTQAAQLPPDEHIASLRVNPRDSGEILTTAEQPSDEPRECFQ